MLHGAAKNNNNNNNGLWYFCQFILQGEFSLLVFSSHIRYLNWLIHLKIRNIVYDFTYNCIIIFVSFRIFFFFYCFLKFLIYFLAVSGLCCCAQAFSSCSKCGATLHHGARASHCGGFSCCRAWTLGAWASVVAARGLSSCGAWALGHTGFSSCAQAQ